MVSTARMDYEHGGAGAVEFIICHAEVSIAFTEELKISEVLTKFILVKVTSDVTVTIAGVVKDYIDGHPLDDKGAGRRIIDRVHETYHFELGGKDFAYDGEKSLFTVGSLPQNKPELAVVLEDIPSNRNNGNASPDGHGSPNESD